MLGGGWDGGNQPRGIDSLDKEMWAKVLAVGGLGELLS